MDDAVRVVRFGEQPRLHLDRRDCLGVALRGDDDARVLRRGRREPAPLVHVGPHRDFDAVDAAGGHVEDQPGAVGSFDFHGARHARATVRAAQARGEDVGIGVPAILHRRHVRGWLELYGNAHDLLRSADDLKLSR